MSTDKGAATDEGQALDLPRFLGITYGTSRGRDTYGYTIVRLTDGLTRRTYRCMGGGYDMVGTVLADWMQDVAQDQLRALPPAVALDLYGMRTRADGSVHLDGACGISSVERIGRAVGIGLRWQGTPRGHTTGYLAVALDS